MRDLLAQLEAADEELDPDREPAFVPARFPATARIARYVIRRKAEGRVAPGAEAAVARTGSSTGAPLPASVRARFEASLGADLSRVRVHTGPESAAAADAVGAMAYAVGDDIHFGAGRYAPEDPFGLHLLAHEVAHTVQQSGAAPMRQDELEVSSPGDASEHEADRAADAMVAGHAAAVSPTAGLSRRTLQRRPNGSDPDAGAPRPAPTGTAPPPASDAPAAAPPSSGTPAAPPAGGAPPATTPGAPPAGPTPAAPPAAGPAGEAAEPATAWYHGSDGWTAESDYDSGLPLATEQLMDQHADPGQKAKLDQLFTDIDALRIQSLQYTYAPAATFLNAVISIVPIDQAIDQYYKGSAYSGGDSLMDYIQSGLERFREIERLCGDAVGAVSNAFGFVAMGAAVIGAEPAAALASFLSTLTGVLKAALDATDLVIGIIQELILCERIYEAAGDPAERARLVALLQKETSDYGGDVMQVGSDVASLGVGAALGAVGDEKVMAGTKSLGDGFVEQFKPAYDPAGALADVNAHFATAAEAERSAGKLDAFHTANAGKSLDQIKLTDLSAVIESMNARDAAPVNLKAARISASSVPATTWLGVVQAESSFQQNSPSPPGSAPGPSAEPTQHALPEAPVQAWPGLITRMVEMRHLVVEAQQHMKHENRMAFGDMSPAGIKRAIGAFGGIEERGTRLNTVALDKRAEADIAEQKGDDAYWKAMGCADSQQKADDQRKNVVATATQGMSVFEGVLGGGYMKKLEGYLLSQAQSFVVWLNGEIVGHLAGLTPAEMQQVTGPLGQKTKLEAATAEAAGAAGAGLDPIQQETERIKAGMSAQDQEAMQAYVDTLRWVERLDAIDQSLATAIHQATQYVAQTAPYIQKETDEQLGSDAPGVDAQYIAPAVTAGTAYVDSSTGALHDLYDWGKAQVAAKVASVAKLPKVAAGIQHDGEETVSNHIAPLTLVVDATQQGLQAGVATLQGLASSNSHDFASARDVAGRMQRLMDDCDHAFADEAAAMRTDLEQGFASYDQAVEGSGGPAAASPDVAPPADAK